MKEINPDIEIKGEYINSDTKIECFCKIHKIIFYSRPYHLKSGKGCPVCGREKLRKMFSKTLEKFKEEMHKLDNTIEIVGDYVNGKTKIKCHCSVCNKYWEAEPNNLLSGKGCPFCASSKGEKKIAKWLEENGIKFLREYRFPNCKDIRPLPFDFYL